MRNLLGSWEAEEDFEWQYLAELLQEERKRAEKLLNKALSLSKKGELKGALVYARGALAKMREIREVTQSGKTT